VPEKISSPNSDVSKRSASKWLWVIAICGLAVWAAIWGFRIIHGTGIASARVKDAPAKARNKNRQDSDSSDPVSIIAVRAHTGTIHEYFDGLGTVTPIYTVTIKSRVDGQLMNVLYKEGNYVKQGDLLIEIDPRPYQVQLEQAQGQLAKDQSALENARLDLRRYTTLLGQNAIQEQQVATQRSTVAQDQALVQVDQAQVHSAELNITYTKITAPISGRIGLRLVDPGNIVHASDATGLLVITQTDPISVLFTLAEDQLPIVMQKLAAGTILPVTVFDRDMKTQFASGTVTTVDNQIDQTTGTVRVRATFDNKNNTLFPNQFVNARLLIKEKPGVVVIPSATVQRNSNSTFVYLVTKDNTVSVRNVAVGTTDGDNVEITSGLRASDVVVLTGVDKLQDGTPVNPQFQDADNSAKSKGKK
jgi:multidrug efflux system membrane fusion protein